MVVGSIATGYIAIRITTINFKWIVLTVIDGYIVTDSVTTIAILVIRITAINKSC